MGKQPMVFLFADHIEHGPLPWSRIKTFKWMPVMATSNYSLVKTPFTEKWFAAAKDQSPLKGRVTIGFHPLEGGDGGLPGVRGLFGAKGVPVQVPEDEAADATELALDLLKQMQAE